MTNIWPTKKLGEICVKTKSVNPKDLFDKQFTYIDISSIDSNSHSVIGQQIISVENAHLEQENSYRKVILFLQQLVHI